MSTETTDGAAVLLQHVEAAEKVRGPDGAAGGAALAWWGTWAVCLEFAQVEHEKRMLTYTRTIYS